MARPNNAAAISGHVQGLREAKAAFQAMPETFRNALNVATETTLKRIVYTAQMRLASSPSIRTRSLFNNVAYTLNKKSGRGKAGVAAATTTMMLGGKRIRVKGIVRAGAGGSALRSAGATVINPSRYAHFVEFGTQKMRAEPFVIPAVKSQEQAYLDRCMAAGKEAEQTLAGIGGGGLL